MGLAASIRTGARKEGACHVWSWNFTALTRMAWICQQCVSRADFSNRELGGGLGQGAGPLASSIPEHYQHPLHVPGTRDTSQGIHCSHDVPQKVQGSTGEYILFRDKDHIAEHEIRRWNSVAEALPRGLHPKALRSWSVLISD